VDGSYTLFRSCDLDLDLMTFMYELDPYPLNADRRPNMNFESSLSKVIVIPTDRQTDRLKEATKTLPYFPLRGWSHTKTDSVGVT